MSRPGAGFFCQQPVGATLAVARKKTVCNGASGDRKGRPYGSVLRGTTVIRRGVGDAAPYEK